jgi:RNA polymerase sigma-70 factor (ECF subfamily)
VVEPPQIEAVYRAEARGAFATLVRLLGDFDLAEEALQDAFLAAVEQWPKDGVPANPRAWLISAARFKAIDALRGRIRADRSAKELLHRLERTLPGPDHGGDETPCDDRLRLIFTCCHPALSSDAQIALTLREVCGLTTEEVARAFLVTPATIAKRIVRAKQKIRDAHIPYEVPSPKELPERLESVLRVVYLVFTEGYATTSGPELTRADLSGEAIHLGRVLLNVWTDAEVQGLLSLMLLHESRREARISPDGELVLLEDQDRSLWKREMIDEGVALVERALASRDFGCYTIQAAIAAVHASAPRATDTSWAKIVEWYDLLLQCTPTPVVELNRAVAIAMRYTPEEGLRLIDLILEHGELQDYYLAHAARGDLLRRMGNRCEAHAAFERALSVARSEPVRRFLNRRVTEAANENQAPEV